MMRAGDHANWLKWPEGCSAAVVRDGEQEACEKPAVAVAVAWAPESDEWEYHEYPVCKHHARGRPLMSLKNVIEIARNGIPS